MSYPGNNSQHLASYASPSPCLLTFSDSNGNVKYSIRLNHAGYYEHSSEDVFFLFDGQTKVVFDANDNPCGFTIANLIALKTTCTNAGGGGGGGSSLDHEFLAADNDFRPLRYDADTATFTEVDGSAIVDGATPIIMRSLSMNSGAVDANTQRFVVEDVMRNATIRSSWLTTVGNKRELTYPDD